MTLAVDTLWSISSNIFTAFMKKFQLKSEGIVIR